MRKRGPYKKYNEPYSKKEIPKSTLRTWKNKNTIKLDESMDGDDSNQIGQIRDFRDMTNIPEPFNELMDINENDERAQIERGPIESHDPCVDSPKTLHEEFINSTDTQCEEAINEYAELNPIDFDTFYNMTKEDSKKKDPKEIRKEKLGKTMCKCTNITMAEVLLICLQIFLKHSLTMVAFIDILRMINFIFCVNFLPETKYMIHQLLNMKLDNISYHIFCCNCHKYIGKTNKFDEPIKCVCGTMLSSSKVGSFFVEMDVYDQLKKLFSDEKIIESLQQRFTRVKQKSEALEDIYDGKVYKKFAEDSSLLGNPLNFSYIFNTDGCQTSFSSKITVWPIYMMINEMPDHLRKKHMILAGLWVSKTEPDMSCFLQPFVDTANELSSKGFSWTLDGHEITSKLFPLGCCVDSPARCSMLNMKQFNGDHGCTYCNHPGERVSETSTIRKYPLQQTVPKLRTDKSIRKQMLEVHEKNLAEVEGVKGPSALMNLKYFDLVKGMIVDFMHACLLGVIKSYTQIILEETGITKKKEETHQKEKRKTNEFYIGSPAKLDLIDKRLMKMRPPTSCAKAPKSIKERHTWKASDWLNWLLFYSIPCLKGILPKKYLQNLALFVAAMHTFLKDSIDPTEVNIGRNLLIKFICGFQDLYGANFMVYNIHLLLHLPDAVLNWGPLGSANTFPFETQNNLLLKMKKCNYRIAQQIVNRHLLASQVDSIKKESTISKNVLDFCKILRSKNQVKIFEKIKDCTLIGKGKRYVLNENELACFRRHLLDVTLEKVTSFNRLIFEKIRYTTVKYSKGKKNNDSVLATKNNEYMIITKIIKVEFNNSSRVIIFGYELILNNQFLISTEDIRINHLKPCSLGKLKVIIPELICKPCVMLSYKENYLVGPLEKGITKRSIN